MNMKTEKMRKKIALNNIAKVYFWNMMGSLCNAASSIVFLMIVSRTVTDGQADIFSMGFSIAQLMLCVATFQVRVFQSTDVDEKYSFTQYFCFRMLTALGTVFLSVFYIVIKGYQNEKAIVVFLLCLFRVIDAIADVFEGLYQQKIRLDLSGKFLTLRIVPSIALFAAVLEMTHNLALGCLSIVVLTAIITVVFSKKYTSEFARIQLTQMSVSQFIGITKKLTQKCFPIFINGFLLTIIYNVPKNTIDGAIGKGILEMGTQTDYNIIFMPAFAVNLLFIFFRPQITQMAIYLHENRIKMMIKRIVELALVILVFSILLAIAGLLLGGPLLGFIYGRELNQYHDEIAWLLVGGGLGTLANLWDNVLTIIRRQHLTTIGYVGAVLVAYFFANKWITEDGITGAVRTNLVSMVVLCSMTFVIMVRELVSIKTKEDEHD